MAATIPETELNWGQIRRQEARQSRRQEHKRFPASPQARGFVAEATMELERRKGYDSISAVAPLVLDPSSSRDGQNGSSNGHHRSSQPHHRRANPLGTPSKIRYMSLGMLVGVLMAWSRPIYENFRWLSAYAGRSTSRNPNHRGGASRRQGGGVRRSGARTVAPCPNIAASHALGWREEASPLL